MERLRNPELSTAPVGYDEFKKHLLAEITVNGELLKNDDHAFFAWLVARYPKYVDIDGVSLRALYEKNVLENGMSAADFQSYCTNFKFPYPTVDNPESDLYFYAFEWKRYKREYMRINDTAYQGWADDHQIDTRPGAQMRFVSIDGDEYVVSTDVVSRGRIIAKNGQASEATATAI